jgi:hypothetical protein
MEHLQEFNVVFTTCVPRSFNGETYFRNNFKIDGNTYSISNPLDLSGLDGTVIFIKKGELNTEGKPVTKDCFSLIGVQTIASLETANRKRQLQNELKKKDE